jgi:hypothetical protein
MVVVCEQPIQAEGSYDTPLQPVGPFWVLEYVSKHNERKDYEDNFRKYERELKVPYFLLFYPDNQDLTLFRLQGQKYRSVTPNTAGRHPIRQLGLEVALLDGWVRYWYKGELLPLPADLQRQVQQLQTQNQHLQTQNQHLQTQNQHLQTRNQHLQAQLEQERAEKERLLAELRKRGTGAAEP